MEARQQQIQQPQQISTEVIEDFHTWDADDFINNDDTIEQDIIVDNIDSKEDILMGFIAEEVVVNNEGQHHVVNDVFSKQNFKQELNASGNISDASTQDYNQQERVQAPHLKSESTQNMQRMKALLDGFDGDNWQRIERRLMTFLCKCQLRALTNQGIDDLYV